MIKIRDLIICYNEGGDIMKKLVFLTLHLNYGGVCSAIVNTANLLSKEYKVQVISIYNFNSPLASTLNPEIELTYLLPPTILPNREAFREAISSKKILHILAEGFFSLKVLYLKKNKMIQAIRTLNNVQVIGSDEFVSSLLSKYGNDSLYKIAWEHHYHRNEEKYINIIKNDYQNIDLLLLLTKQAEEEYKVFLQQANNHKTKVDVAPNVLLYQKIEPSSLSNHQCLFVGRFDPIKGIERMLKIFAATNSDWTLKLVGDGPQHKEIETWIKDFHLQNRVIFTGSVTSDEVIKQMQAASIFLMTSYSEGLPMVLLEAMSVGLPCIAYDVPTGPSEIIQHQENGYLIPDKHEADYLFYLNQLMKDETLRISMREACLSTARKYDEEHLLKIWHKLLER